MYNLGKIALYEIMYFFILQPLKIYQKIWTNRNFQK